MLYTIILMYTVLIRRIYYAILHILSYAPHTISYILYSTCCRSVFGEDALVNVSVERKDDASANAAEGKLAGYIRIRYECMSDVYMYSVEYYMCIRAFAYEYFGCYLFAYMAIPHIS